MTLGQEKLAPLPKFDKNWTIHEAARDDFYPDLDLDLDLDADLDEDTNAPQPSAEDDT